MRRATLYSNSPRSRGVVRPASPSPAPRPEKPVEAPVKPKWRDLYKRCERPAMLVALAVMAICLFFMSKPVPQAISQGDIDAAVARSLSEQPLPSAAAKVYDAVKGAIVLVRAIGDALETDEYLQKAVGTGVVAVNRGTILTLHVVAGAGRIRVVFADGLESEAKIVGQHPENDLAVLQAETVPDDLAAAVMRPRADLQPGDAVVAVGFPFGIGPSVSAGVVSGLKREYRSPNGERLLSELIQFDAAVNPGSSGGALLNAAGEVVGIVTAMLDPGGGGFAGIGFAVPIETASAAAGTPPF
jgi:S1-C subfamily serine protease